MTHRLAQLLQISFAATILMLLLWPSLATAQRYSVLEDPVARVAAIPKQVSEPTSKRRGSISDRFERTQQRPVNLPTAVQETYLTDPSFADESLPTIERTLKASNWPGLVPSTRSTQFKTPVVKSRPTVHTPRPSRASHPTLKTAISGPSHLKSGSSAIYQVTIANVTDQRVDNIEVKLNLARGVRVTVLDREASYDWESNKLAWNVLSIEPGQKERIQFKATSSEPGFHQLAVQTTTDQSLQGDAKLSTYVIGRQEVWR